MEEVRNVYKDALKKEFDINDEIQKEFENWLKIYYPDEKHHIFLKYLELSYEIRIKKNNENI